VSESDPDGRPLSASDGSARALRPDAIRFGSDGLVPAVVVDAGDREVLMLAWMNRESLERSLATGRTVFWSRSRQELWEKGATSGHVQRIVDIRTDCDQDALVISVEQTGAACHTGERSCFHHALTGPG
jgi:phosphoribosyl-ATP pyrophosphohydrolase/phosphoribosyl-AMP cyclohydrolase